MSDTAYHMIHIIVVSFLGSFAYSIRKKLSGSYNRIKQIVVDTFINGMFGIAIGMFVATYSENQYFILSITTLAALYGDRVISSFFKGN